MASYHPFPLLPHRQTVSYFGVFDGHGGFKASQYCADRLGLYLKNSPEFPNGDVEAAYKKAYLQIDEDFIDTGKVSEGEKKGHGRRDVHSNSSPRAGAA